MNGVNVKSIDMKQLKFLACWTIINTKLTFLFVNHAYLFLEPLYYAKSADLLLLLIRPEQIQTLSQEKAVLFFQAFYNTQAEYIQIFC